MRLSIYTLTIMFALPLAAQVTDIHFGIGQGAFRTGKGVIGRSSTSVVLSDLESVHVAFRYADTLSARSSVRFMVGLEQFRFHYTGMNEREISDIDLTLHYGYLGLEPTFRPLRRVSGLVLSIPVKLSFRAKARASGSYASYYMPDTSYTFTNDPVPLGGFNIEVQSALAYEVPISEKMGLAFGGFAGYGLLDQTGGAVKHKLYHFGFRVAVFHRSALARFFPPR